MCTGCATREDAFHHISFAFSRFRRRRWLTPLMRHPQDTRALSSQLHWHFILHCEHVHSSSLEPAHAWELRLIHQKDMIDTRPGCCWARSPGENRKGGISRPGQPTVVLLPWFELVWRSHHFSTQNANQYVIVMCKVCLIIVAGKVEHRCYRTSGKNIHWHVLFSRTLTQGDPGSGLEPQVLLAALHLPPRPSC